MGDLYLGMLFLAIASAGLSTHALSLQMAAEFLKARSGAQLAVVAIQPGDVGTGSELSAEVSRAVRLLQEVFCASFASRLDRGPDWEE